MTSSEERSPELIREYFSLLEWKKNGCLIQDDSIARHESLQALENASKLICEKIILTKTLLSENITSLASVRASVESINGKIFTNQREAQVLKEEVATARKIKTRLDMQDTSAPEPSDKTTILEEPDQELLKTLLLEFFTDLKKDFLSILIFFKKRSINTFMSLIILFLIFLLIRFIVSLIFNEGLGHLFVLAVFILSVFYFSQKFRVISQENNQKIQNYLLGAKAIKEQKIRNAHVAGVQKKLSELDERFRFLRARHESCLAHQSQILESQEKLEVLVREENQRLLNLERVKQDKDWEYQYTIEKLIVRQKQEHEARLKNLEIKAEEWLRSDIKRLTHKAMKKMGILLPSSTGELNALMTEEPLRVLIGTTERTAKSMLVESDSDTTLGDFNAQKILINSDDFRSEYMYEFSSVKRYGVYEFLVIFLCANFLAYYKCHFNFIQGRTVNDETCEYLYDSIVSVRVQEKSSTKSNSGEDKDKEIYAKRLLLTTKDGKVICFRVEKSKTIRVHSLTLSQIDEAVVAIRSMLRQRRVDKTYTQDLDRLD